MPKPRPKPQARGLATGLRAARKATDLTSTAVGTQLGWSQSTVSRIETGKRNASPDEVIAMLALYGVKGPERERLLSMARDADRSTWLETHQDRITNQAVTLTEYESEAVELTLFQLVLIPGLLQTVSYTRAMMNAGGVSAANIEPRVQQRADRQRVLDTANPPQVLAIIDEAVLHRRIGGKRVMAEQLRHLLTMADRPNIDLRVIPFDHGGHSGINGAFFLARFEKDRPIVHVENLRSGLFLDDPADVGPYEVAIASMTAIALDPSASAEMVEEALGRYERSE
ncbi:helix-turn-helix domain-containing protein [Actinokineospora spheciospongiae]|uniref:helix-turn-helix domain-containing protein n=1 Tax=Actinokineospora spheciospongiae TaxID=909613 RepID=UPI000D71AF78|nr:helix-turn-helix transcriptional regulator [Actinokineospora spheciospongiae]PWW64454.1 helix-turn-helix protein [Actinokineospora spheciospongiae]